MWNQSIVDNRGVSKGRSVGVGIRVKWKMTCDMWHVICDMWLVTCNTWFLYKVPKKVRSSAENENNWLKSAKKCRKMSKRRDSIILVLLSAHAERVGVPFILSFIWPCKSECQAHFSHWNIHIICNWHASHYPKTFLWIKINLCGNFYCVIVFCFVCFLLLKKNLLLVYMISLLSHRLPYLPLLNLGATFSALC